MPLGFNLGHLITAAMVLVSVGGALRWRRLDRGGRCFVGAVGASTAFVPFSLALLFAGRSNHLLNEVSLLVETGLILAAFAWWQPTAARQRVMWWIEVGFVTTWIVAQAIQGPAADFSYISIPVAGLVKVGAAGFTLVGRIQAADGRWTDSLWFWTTLGVMVIYGTEVVLDPLWAQALGMRDDLSVAAFAVNTVGNVVGYGLMARGLWRLPPVAAA